MSESKVWKVVEEQRRAYSRPEPIMLLELPIMLLSIIPKTSLLCLKLCSGILSDNVKFNRLN